MQFVAGPVVATREWPPDAGATRRDRREAACSRDAFTVGGWMASGSASRRRV